MSVVMLFFFKQKTAYEMRISDWSSDVCSSDLDMIFIEAPTSVEQIERIAKDLPYPKLINMFHGGKTSLVGSDRLGELGYSLVIIPSDTQRAAIKAMQETLAAIARDGHSGALQEHMVSFNDREEIDRKSTRLNSSH